MICLQDLQKPAIILRAQTDKVKKIGLLATRGSLKFSFTHLRNNGKDGDDETFIKKIINNLTGNQGGLVPGLAPIPSENENGKDDIEKNNRNEEIPLSDLADASKIVDVHEGDDKEKLEALKLEGDVNCTSDGETLGSSSKNSFLAPAVDHFDDYAENNSSDDNEGFIETSTYVPLHLK